jgi:poly(hydroxyalkanoate) depolymerase family esterase
MGFFTQGVHDMFDNLPNGLRKASRLPVTGRLMEATAAIQRLLGGNMATPPTANSQRGHEPPIIDGLAERMETVKTRVANGPPKALRNVAGKVSLRDLVRGKAGVSSISIVVPDGARFLSATFTNDAGSRPYKLYVPSGYRAGQLVPLVVMLHGCTQSMDDFAAGTRMNEIAEERNALVVYPGQTGAANMQKCWNWFNKSDQGPGAGEPSLIAGITRKVMADYTVDPKRVYVAGLSAGGATAAIMGEAYPELYAAIGVHSGLACGAAHDMPSAFAAMRQGATGKIDDSGPRNRVIPAIVFHGDQDTTVNRRNGDFVVAQAMGASRLEKYVEEGKVPGGHAYTRTVHTSASGGPVIEQWVIQGASHAWAGGSPLGSYTDPRGPNATKEMMRFFLEHPRTYESE